MTFRAKKVGIPEVPRFATGRIARNGARKCTPALPPAHFDRSIAAVVMSENCLRSHVLGKCRRDEFRYDGCNCGGGRESLRRVPSRPKQRSIYQRPFET